eukprot:12521184-Alexandrium_andersonii.AAC.1
MARRGRRGTSSCPLCSREARTARTCGARAATWPPSGRSTSLSGARVPLAAPPRASPTRACVTGEGGSRCLSGTVRHRRPA